MDFIFDNTIIANKERTASEFDSIIKLIKSDIIKSLAIAGSGHPGGALGISDLMSVLWFGGIMNYKADMPDWNLRDRFVLSAGHYATVLYSCLARAGLYNAAELANLRKHGSILQGHPSSVGSIPGNETASGSLGQGISIAVGMAMADKLIDKNHRNVFCLTGDGELQEGSCWEAAMSASMYKLSNLCWIVDYNDCQIDGRVGDVMNIAPLNDKFKAFGFEVIEINGNNIDECIEALNKFIHNSSSNIEKPTCIIAKTFMGNGISFMQDNYKWHGNPPTIEQAKQALAELGVA